MTVSLGFELNIEDPMNHDFEKVVQELSDLEIDVNRYNIDPDYVISIDETIRGKLDSIKLYLKRLHLKSMLEELDDVQLKPRESIHILEFLKKGVLPNIKLLFLKKSDLLNKNQSSDLFDSRNLESLIHPLVKSSAFQHFLNENYREAVLNAMIALFDLIRQKTGLSLDGSNLVEKSLSLGGPYLILSELETESGKNDQKGFLQMMSGAYLGIRNPKAHTLLHDLNKNKTAQYLVFISLLVRRIDESKIVKMHKA